MAPFAPVILTAFIAGPAIVKATAMTTWSGQGCGSGDVVFWTGHSAGCQAINNVKSVRVTALDSGCTATIYADQFCSNNPLPARVNDCVSTSGQIGSFSWDC